MEDVKKAVEIFRKYDLKLPVKYKIYSFSVIFFCFMDFHFWFRIFCNLVERKFWNKNLSGPDFID